MDDTRIHINDYAYARRAAADARDYEGNDFNEPVEDVLRDPSVFDIGSYISFFFLNATDLEAFARSLADKGMGNHLQTLQLIKAEFNNPFKDPRRAFAELTSDHVWTILTVTLEALFYNYN